VVATSTSEWQRGLPRPRTSFVGRHHEIAEARRLLRSSSLLTLTGPGGCGKTRLALELAAGVADDFPRGAQFVGLAAIRDPSLVPVSVAQAVGLQDSRGGSLLEHLSRYIADGELLLILDNFEQVLPAADFVAELLAACARLRIVVTSRSPLHLSGEQEFPVSPLPVPVGGAAVSAAAVSAADSAQLFAVRAAALLPGFTIDERTAKPIADIVHRLDGLPLAIELAAARVKVLPLAAIPARLDDALGFLVGAGRDVPDRQRTLRATIAWSYDLLSGDAQRLLAAMSVFRGGAALDDVEAVCRDALQLKTPVLDALQELVDHNLVRLAGSATVPRYVMLESVREFAAEDLRSRVWGDAVQAAHAAQFRRRGDGLARPPLWPAREGLDRLESEHDNLRAALDWYRERNPSAALHLANRLTAFWSARGHFSEGRRRLGELLAVVPADDPEWVDGMNGAAWLATDQGDFATATALFDRSVARARAGADRLGEASALFFRGRSRLMSSDPAGGGADIARAMELQAAVGDEAGRAAALWFAALPHAFVGADLPLAADLLERSAELATRLDLPAVSARAWMLLGIVKVELGDLAGARAVLAQGVPALVDIGDRFAIPGALSALAGLAAATGRPRAALNLAGAAAAYEETNHTYRPAALQTFLAKWLAAAQKAPSAARYVEDGRRLSLDEAVALGLAEPRSAQATAGLTRREAQVATLVARGLSNRQVAAELFLSVRTVEVHVDHVLSKLGFGSRTQLAVWAHEDGSPWRNT
jgi:non-specific serine/threonine protein kinase